METDFLAVCVVVLCAFGAGMMFGWWLVMIDRARREDAGVDSDTMV